MMMNLFSSFDPSTSLFIPLNWLILPIIILFIPQIMFMNNYPVKFLFLSMIFSLFKEFKQIMEKHFIEGSMNIIFMFFIFIIWSNSLGLLPFIFTSTSHLMTTLLLALSSWISFFLFGVMNQIKTFLAHLVPLGTPSNLMMFMVLIESVSLMIRPITLSVRLSANMIAGHLLLTLLGNSFFNFNLSNYILLYFSQILLLILEMAVAVIQAYVFTMLMILYSMEI